jgi:hypothetical protein
MALWLVVISTGFACSSREPTPTEGSAPAPEPNWKRLPTAVAAEYWYDAVRSQPNGVPAGVWSKVAKEVAQRPAHELYAIEGSSWTEIGPAPIRNVQSWPGSGRTPGAGRATVVAVNLAAPWGPSHPNGELWLGTANGGVWHRAANATRWDALTDGTSSLAVGAIAVDGCGPNTCDTVYVGTGENAFRRDTYYGTGIIRIRTFHDEIGTRFVFDDPFGETGPSMFRFGAVQNLIIDPTSPSNDRTLYATMSNGVTTNSTDSSISSPLPASGLGVFRFDAGSWKRKSPAALASSVGAVDLEMDPNDSTHLYAAFHGNGLFKSVDKGETWTSFNNGITASLISGATAAERPEIALIHEGSNPPTLYAVLGQCGPPHQLVEPFAGCVPALFKIIDTGATPSWQKLPATTSASVPNIGGTLFGTALFQYAEYTHALTVVPTPPGQPVTGSSGQTILFGGINLWKSTDGGQSFSGTAIENNFIHPDYHQILVPDPSNANFLLATSDGGLYSTQTGGVGPPCADLGAMPVVPCAWKSENNFLQITGLQSIAVSPTDGQVLGASQDNGTNLFNGILRWEHLSDGDSASAFFDVDAPSQLFDVEVGAVPRNITTPLSSVELVNPVLSATDPVAFYPPMIQAQTGPSPHPIYLGTNQLYRSITKGTSWTLVSPALGGTTFFPDINMTNVVTAIAVAPSMPNRIVIGYYDGQIWITDSASTSAAAWSQIGGSAKGLPNRVVTGMAIDPDSADTLYVTYSGFGTLSSDSGNHVFVSSNRGGSYVALTNGLAAEDPVNTILIEKGPPKRLWIGTDHGVFRKTADGADAWTRSFVGPGGIGSNIGGMPNVPVYALAIDEVHQRFYAGTHGRGAWVLAPTPIVATFEGWVDGKIWDLPTYGSGLPLNQTGCTVSVELQNGQVCATGTVDAFGGTIGTDASGQLVTSKGTSYNNKPVVWACLNGTCLGNTPIANCLLPGNTISTVRVQCGGVDVRGSVGTCPASLNPPNSGMRMLPPVPGGNPPLPPPAPAPMSFQLHAAIQVGSGGTDQLCGVSVPFLSNEEDGVVLGRAASALTADPACAAAGVSALFDDEGGGPRQNEDESFNPARIGLKAPLLNGTELITSVRTKPGAATGVCFSFDNLGSGTTRALIISRLSFEAAAAGATGGGIRVTERSALGECLASVPTSAGATAATVAAAVRQALLTSSATCPALENPLDVTGATDHVTFVAAREVVVCVDDPGVGFSFRPEEIDLPDLCTAANDKKPPVFTSVPPSVTISQCTTPNIGQATATDECGVTITNNAPSKFPLGTTTVTWRAIDPAGNVKTATQIVMAILGDDPSCCPTGTNVMLGTSASERITGTAGRDCILGLGGDDTIDARDGNDFVSGGAGNDTINAGLGNDLVWGGSGNDTVDASGGDDFIDGGTGTDTCAGSSGVNKITRCEVVAGCTAACCNTNTCTP